MAAVMRSKPSKYLLRVEEISAPQGGAAATDKVKVEQQTTRLQVQKNLNEVHKIPLSSVSTASTASPSDDYGGDDQDDHRTRDVQKLLKEAYCPADVKMIEVFAKLLSLSAMTPEFVKPVIRSMKLLRLCDYTGEDICCIMAHAGAYFKKVYELCGNDMDASEVGNVTATLLFIAHSYTQDEVCPLKVWHKHLFKKYCTMRLLNAAVFRLLRICHFKLRVKNDTIDTSFRHLMNAAGVRIREDWKLPETFPGDLVPTEQRDRAAERRRTTTTL